jgi:hypothetical protein
VSSIARPQTGAPEAAPLSIVSVAVSVVQQPVVKATLITGATVLLGTLLFSIYKGAQALAHLRAPTRFFLPFRVSVSVFRR